MTSHTIYSHFRNRDLDDLSTKDDEESAAQNCYMQRRPPPRFVPASNSTRTTISRDDTTLGTDIANWYRSLAKPRSKCKKQKINEPPYKEGISEATTEKVRSERNEENSPIEDAIGSESSRILPPSLAEIITRDPPPLPTERRYCPPTWLAIGPGNKGFKMLESRGWSEGEPLGLHFPRCPRSPPESPSRDVLQVSSRKNGATLAEEYLEVSCDDLHESIKHGATDLSKSETCQTPVCNEINDHQPDIQQSCRLDQPSQSRTALITPIPIVLKSDRLGIGLKAKAVGPYKTSQKRVTHGAAALAANAEASEERRKLSDRFGHGRRGYAKQQLMKEKERKILQCKPRQVFLPAPVTDSHFTVCTYILSHCTISLLI